MSVCFALWQSILLGSNRLLFEAWSYRHAVELTPMAFRAHAENRHYLPNCGRVTERVGRQQQKDTQQKGLNKGMLMTPFLSKTRLQRVPQRIEDMRLSLSLAY